MLAAFERRDGGYEGIFIVAVRTTGIFCRPTCPARRPRPENVEFFADPPAAAAAGYRPCLRCRPLERAGTPPEWLRGLLEALEAAPGRRWRDRDLRELGMDPTRVRRWFLREHGVTFHAYQRARRLGAALGRLGRGREITDTAFASGYESESGFRDAFQKLFGAPPGASRGRTHLVVSRLSTPLGTMVAATSDEALYLLEFADRRRLAGQIDRLRRHVDAAFVPGESDVAERTRRELEEYFAGERRSFDVPLVVPGTPFQREVWEALRDIPHGSVRSYAEQARAIGRPSAVRAVGRANGDNRIGILIPCHRVVGADGALVGYGGSLWRKRALLELEGALHSDG